MSLSTKMSLDAAGEVTGESITTAAGPYSTALRGIAARAQGMGTEGFAASILRERDGGGTGDVTVDPLVPVTDTYRISGTFKLAPQPGWLDGDSFALPTGLRVIQRPADGLAGPLEMRNLPVTEATPCYAGQQEETLSLQLYRRIEDHRHLRCLADPQDQDKDRQQRQRRGVAEDLAATAPPGLIRRRQQTVHTSGRT